MAVEIKQALEREFEIVLTAPELRTLTFGKLQELTDSITKGDKVAAKSMDSSKKLADVQRNMILRSLGNEKTAHDLLMPLNAHTEKPSDVCALFITGIEGVANTALVKSCNSIEIPTYALQLNAFFNAKTFPELMALISEVNLHEFSILKKKIQFIFRSQDILKLFSGRKRFILIGHSFGGYVAIKLAKLLEQHGLTGEVVSIDGSVIAFNRGMKIVMPNINVSDESVENFILMHMAFEALPDLQNDVIYKVFADHKTYMARCDAIIDMITQPEYSRDYLKSIYIGALNRTKMIMTESDNFNGERIRSNITLIRPTIHLVPGMENDYNLKQYTDGRVLVSFIEGNHLTILDNIQLYQILNNICTSRLSS